MGTTPKVTKKPKYNKDDKFRWVDSQWEKFMTEQKELKAKIQELELRVREADNLNEDLEEENEMMRSFLPPDDFHMTNEDFYEIVDEYKHKYKKKYKKLKSKYKSFKKEFKELVKRTPSNILNPRGDEWRIEQFNRNRAPEDQVHTIQEMSDRVSDLFPEKKTYIYESPDGGKTLYRREFGKSDKELVDE